MGGGRTISHSWTHLCRVAFREPTDRFGGCLHRERRGLNSGPLHRYVVNSGIGYRVSGIGYRVSGIGYRVSGKAIAKSSDSTFDLAILEIYGFRFPI
jgi:hypothetical protein